MMDIDREKIFERYIQIADILGQMFPNVLEVAVHSFEDLDRAIIHLVNGHISGRKIGGPASELNMRRLLEEGQFPDVLLNYASRNYRGQQLKSSSLAIRDNQGKIIGAFCMHFDVSQFEQFQTFLEHLISIKIPSFLGVNDFGATQPHNEEIKDEINAYLLQQGLYGAALTYKDKQNIVVYLHGRGWFTKKGAITGVANALQLTRQSIYNYIELSKQSRNSPFSANQPKESNELPN